MTYPLERDWDQRKCDTVRITLFFPFFCYKSLGNISDKKEREQKTLSEEDKGYKTELIMYVKRRIYDLKLSILYTC